MPSNQAAWIASKGARLHVDTAPYPTVEAGHVIVKNAAVAINSVDWKMQDFGMFVQSWPAVLGGDVAGEVVEVGAGVSNIRQGQRVIGHAVGLVTGQSQDGAFQLYSRVPAVLAAPIPDDMRFEDAVVLPLCLSTAAAGLYQKFALALPLPTAANPEPTGSTVLVWGASSAVGSSAVQLAVASGVAVVATASKRNFDYVKALGAQTVVDHSSPTVVEDLVNALKAGGRFAGAFDCVGLPESGRSVVQVVSQLGGGMVADVLDTWGDLPEGVKTNWVFAPSIKDTEVSKAVYEDYLPTALKDGSFKPMPTSTVVGKGLESVQAGFDKLKQGVSASKIVVSLQ